MKGEYKAKPFYEIVPRNQSAMIPCEGYFGFIDQTDLIIGLISKHPKFKEAIIDRVAHSKSSGSIKFSIDKIEKTFSYEFKDEDDYINKDLTKNLNEILFAYGIEDSSFIDTTWDEIDGAWLWALVNESQKNELEYWRYINNFIDVF